MAGFRFLSSEFEKEIRALIRMSASFVDRGSPPQLTYFLSDFKSIMGRPVGSCHELVLKPLRTRISEGEYEAGSKRRGKRIYAVISGIWQLRVLSSGSKQQLEFCGKASMTTEIFATDESGTPLAMWQLDLGTDDSPGCYVHAQIPWGFEAKKLNQNPIPVPRLPSIFVTPMSSIEFVLGELFQDAWPKVTAGQSHDPIYWRTRQKKLLLGLFSWYESHLKNKSDSSPWVTLKRAKPNGRLLAE